MTVLDHRRLVFDAPALRGCIDCGGRVAQRLGLPPPAPYNLHIRPEEGCIEVVHAGDAPGRTEISRFNRAHIAALLIDYCIGAGIPVPRGCNRNITVHEAGVVLTFTQRITGSARPRPAA